MKNSIEKPMVNDQSVSGFDAQHGVTLVEMLVVLVVVGIMMAVGFAVFGFSKEDAFRKEAVAAARFYALAVEEYRVDNDGIVPYAHVEPTAEVPEGEPHHDLDYDNNKINDGGWNSCKDPLGSIKKPQGQTKTICGPKFDYERVHGPINTETGERYLEEIPNNMYQRFDKKQGNGSFASGHIQISWGYGIPAAGSNERGYTISYIPWNQIGYGKEIVDGVPRSRPVQMTKYTMMVWDNREVKRPFCYFGDMFEKYEDVPEGRDKLQADFKWVKNELHKCGGA